MDVEILARYGIVALAAWGLMKMVLNHYRRLFDELLASKSALVTQVDDQGTRLHELEKEYRSDLKDCIARNSRDMRAMVNVLRQRPCVAHADDPHPQDMAPEPGPILTPLPRDETTQYYQRGKQ